MTKPDDWLIAKWQRNGFPLTVRMATAYREMGRVPGYEHKIIVVIPLNNPQPSGMPQGDEFDALKAVELSICNLLEAENESLCVLAITGCGTRDLIFYTRNPEQAREMIARAQESIVSHKIDAAIEPDRWWELYGFFNKSIGATLQPETKN
ncbi:MAG TPA: DUF695 domain-containing protein [Terracidiphilus sp.]|nr:DUF695 domain-containing protein [Terracidiphilus sp.]